MRVYQPLGPNEGSATAIATTIDWKEKEPKNRLPILFLPRVTVLAIKLHDL